MRNLLAMLIGQEFGSRMDTAGARRWTHRRPWSVRVMGAVWIVALGIAACGYLLARMGRGTLGACVGVAAIGAGVVISARWSALRRIKRSEY
jgi:hypothetical protein